MDTQPYLLDLLDRGVNYDPHYLPSMNSDHLPMLLCAMAALGADQAQLSAERERYQQRLRPEVQGPTLAHWRDGIGRMECYAPLRRHFSAEIERSSVDACLHAHLHEFFPSLAQTAFHGVIRLAYAIDFGSPAEVAAGLAYMAASCVDTPITTTRINIAQVMRTQAAQPAQEFSSERFGARIRQLIEQDAYPEGCAASMAECAAVALDVFRSTRNFFALHMVTATQAARICQTYLDEDIATASVSGALLAAHLAVGSPDFDPNNVLPVVSLDEEHDYKYGWSCLSEYRRYGDARYREEIAALVEGRILPDWITLF
ncbi:MAG: questin oxidase family protein [Pseudomonadota bacterium]